MYLCLLFGGSDVRVSDLVADVVGHVFENWYLSDNAYAFAVWCGPGLIMLAQFLISRVPINLVDSIPVRPRGLSI